MFARIGQVVGNNEENRNNNKKYNTLSSLRQSPKLAAEYTNDSDLDRQIPQDNRKKPMGGKSKRKMRRTNKRRKSRRTIKRRKTLQN